MEVEAKRPRRPPARLFSRRKNLLLNYLEAFHLARDVDALFDSLQSLLREEFNTVGILFSLLDVRRRRLVYHLPQVLRGVPVVAGEGFSGLALTQRRASCFRSSEGPLPYHALPETLDFVRPTRSVMVSPLIRDGRVIGTIELIDRQDGREFSSADLGYLGALAPHMAVALNHFVLAEEARRREQEEARLKELSRSINSSLNLEEILDQILQHLRGLIPYDAVAMILFRLMEQAPEYAIYGYAPAELEVLADKARHIEHHWLEQGAVPRLFSQEDREEFLCLMPLTAQSELLIPLRTGERLLGLLSVVSREKEAYAQTDLDLLDAFGGQASLAIERARLHRSLIEKLQLEQELKISRDIQLRFLPREMPQIKGLQVAAGNVASRLVSGDYYDFIGIVEGQWGVVIGDVSGKGVSAGLIMSAFRASLLAEIRNNFSIATILSKVNRLLWETTDRNRFVTAFYGVFDEKERVFTYSNAGHNPPLLLRADGSVLRLDTGGTLLGAFRDSRFEEARMALRPGDLLLLYTDGLSECPGPNQQELGISGLEQALREHYDLPAPEIVEHLIEQTTRYLPSDVPEDDVTLVVIKVMT